MHKATKTEPDLNQYVQGVLSGDRIVLSRAITLVESNLEKDRIMAGDLIEQIHDKTGKSIRIGVTGVPGVGKSTFIETFGLMLTSKGKSVAVLTIDPSSQISQGSILGDKTRMEKLSNDPKAYIRPTASGEALGGVGSKTREALLLCEAAGYDVIIIETVGVGQSETAVYGMVDFFLLLMLAGAGDELQGMKRGIMEMADAIVITKSDGENREPSSKARAEFQSAIHLMPPKPSGWIPKVSTCSSTENQGIEEVWGIIEDHRHNLLEKGLFNASRQEQNLKWFRDMISWQLLSSFRQHPGIKESLKSMEKQVRDGKIAATNAARVLIRKFESGRS